MRMLLYSALEKEVAARDFYQSEAKFQAVGYWKKESANHNWSELITQPRLEQRFDRVLRKGRIKGDPMTHMLLIHLVAKPSLGHNMHVPMCTARESLPKRITADFISAALHWAVSEEQRCKPTKAERKQLKDFILRPSLRCFGRSGK